jgi:hypothetical protein
MAHRIREAMREDIATSGPLGGEGKTVEADETYHGKVPKPRGMSHRGLPYVKGGAGRRRQARHHRPCRAAGASARSIPARPIR